MNEQRAPDLEQMDERAAHDFLTELYSLLNIEAEDRIRHDDYTMEWPQSGERLRGRQTMRAFQDANAGSRPPRRLRRVLVRGLWVVEGEVHRTSLRLSAPGRRECGIPRGLGSAAVSSSPPRHSA
jgi:hypothetical protein